MSISEEDLFYLTFMAVKTTLDYTEGLLAGDGK
jgi:hypothetical protein